MRAGQGSPPDFLWNLVASVNFMRLSSRKGAHAVLSSAAWQEIRVREMAKKCVVSVISRPLRGFFGFGALFFRSALGIRDRWRIGGRDGFSPGFPVEFAGFGELHASFFTERRTRGSLQCSVAGNPGPGSG